MSGQLALAVSEEEVVAPGLVWETLPVEVQRWQRLDRAVAVAFLEAVSPAGVSASVGEVGELESQHEQRLALQRLAVERADTRPAARSANTMRASRRTCSSRGLSRSRMSRR